MYSEVIHLQKKGGGGGGGDMLKSVYDKIGGNKQVAFADQLANYVPYVTASQSLDMGNFGIYSNITGINQIVQRNSLPTYGDSDINPLYIHGSIVVNGKIFMGSRAATPNNKIFRYNDPANDLSDFDEISLASNLYHIERMVYDDVNENIIFCANNNTDDGIFRLFTLDPDTLAVVEVFTSATLGWTESPGFEYIDGKIVGGSYQDPAKLFRIDVATWTLEEYVVISPSIRRIHSAGYTRYTDRVELYMTSSGGGSGTFIKVDPTDLTTYELLTLPHASYTDDLAVIQVDDTYSYVYTGSEQQAPDEEIGVRIKTDDLTTTMFFAKPTFGFFYDGTDLWNMAFTGSIQKYPLADITKPQTYDTAGHNPNEFFSVGGKKFFTDWNVTGGIYEFDVNNNWLPAGGYFANALGTGATADANFSNAFGVFSHIEDTAIEGVSMGNYNKVTGAYSGAFGFNLQATATNSYIYGAGVKIGVLNDPGINNEAESIYFAIPSSNQVSYPLKLTGYSANFFNTTINAGNVNVGGVIASVGEITPTITALPSAYGGGDDNLQILASVGGITLRGQTLNLASEYSETLASLSTLALTENRAFSFQDKSGILAMTDDNVSQFTNDAGYINGSSLASYVFSNITNTAGRVPFFNGDKQITDDSNFVWDNTNKRLGIGTNTPSAKFEVSSGGGANSGINLKLTSASSYGTIDFNTPSGLAGQFVTTGASFSNNIFGGDEVWLTSALTNGSAGVAAYGTNGYIRFVTAGIASSNERMRITKTGYTGIGTASPSYRLQVSGTTQADGIRSDMGFDVYGVPAPIAPTLALVAGAGNVNTGSHWYMVTYTTALGETEAGAYATITTDTTTNGQVTVTIPVSTDPRVTGRKIYRAAAGLSQSTMYLLTTIANNTATSYTDNISDATLVANGGVQSAGFYRSDTTTKWITKNGSKIMSADLNNTFFGVNVAVNPNGAGRNAIFGHGTAAALSTGIANAIFGAYATAPGLSSGNFNTGIGAGLFNQLTTGSENVGMGHNTLLYGTISSKNTAIGDSVMFGRSGVSPTGTTSVGYFSGYQSPDYGAFFGYMAGRYETANYKIILDTADRSTEANGRLYAPFYSVVNSSTPALQTTTLGGMGTVSVRANPAYTLTKAFSIGGHLDFNSVADTNYSAMTATLAGAGAGNLSNGVYSYSVFYKTAEGETSSPTYYTVQVTVVDKTTNGRVQLANIPVSTDPRVTGRVIYRSLVNGGIYVNYYIGVINDNTTTTFLDNVADTSLSGKNNYRKPNTTAGAIFLNGNINVYSPDIYHTSYGVAAGAQAYIQGLGSSYVFIGGLCGTAALAGGTMVGYGAGDTCTTGASNNFFGYATGSGNITGQENSSFGENSSRNNYSNSYSYNTVVGASAFSNLKAGSNYNVVIGRYQGAMTGNSTNYMYTSILIGASTGTMTLNNGASNILIGMNADVPTAVTSNFFNLGNSLFATGIQTDINRGGLSLGTKWGFGIKAPVSIVDIGLLTDSTVVDTPIAFQVAKGGTNGFLTASSGDQYFAQISPSINQSGSAGWVGLRIFGQTSNAGSGQQTLLQLGDNTNNTKFEADGSMKMMGTATVWEDLTSSTLLFKVQGTGISNNPTESTVDFLTNADYPTDYIYTNFQMSHSKKIGSTVYPHLHWEQEEDQTPNWLIEYRWQNQLTGKTTAWDSLVLDYNAVAYSTIGGTVNQITTNMTGITPSTDNLSDILQIRLYRDTANDSGKFGGNDPYSNDARTTFVDIHYEKDTIGSRTEFTK